MKKKEIKKVVKAKKVVVKPLIKANNLHYCNNCRMAMEFMQEDHDYTCKKCGYIIKIQDFK